MATTHDGNQPNGECDSQPALVDRRYALRFDGDQLPGPPDAVEPGALPQERIRLDEHRLRELDHRVSPGLFRRADAQRKTAGSDRHAARADDFGPLVFRGLD